jgi:BMFP domain-containing protein YqiC
MALAIETVKSIIDMPLIVGPVVPVLSQFACIGPLEILPQHYLDPYRSPLVFGADGRKEIAMSTGPNRILDEFAKLMTDAAGAAQGVRREVETAFNAHAERWLNSMDIVKREEFEAVREMAIKARDENEALLARIDALEAKLASKSK